MRPIMVIGDRRDDRGKTDLPRLEAKALKRTTRLHGFPVGREHAPLQYIRLTLFHYFALLVLEDAVNGEPDLRVQPGNGIEVGVRLKHGGFCA